MSHFRTVQKMSRYKTNLAPSLQKKIDAHRGDLKCPPRDLLPAFLEVDWEDLKLKIWETQCIVQQAVNYWEETRDVIDLLIINKYLSKVLSPQDTFISNQNLDDAFIVDPNDVAEFRAMIHSIQKEYIYSKCII